MLIKPKIKSVITFKFNKLFLEKKKRDYEINFGGK